MTFSTHSLVRDPPFSRINLVSCRNLLIYFDGELQEKIIPLFHYSLAKAGILLLGSSESTARHQELFEAIDKEARIYLRRDTTLPRSRISVSTGPQSEPSRLAYQSVRRTVDSFKMPQEFIQPDQDRENPPGEFAIEPEPDAASNGLKGFFSRMTGNAPSLKSELDYTKRQLKTLSDQHQTALEELRSAIEELHSVNEEMQSTNEELETSKEELQSVNEELRTVNMRLSEKVEELDDANSDLRNLFESTEIATVFLDEFMLIRSFTPAIGTLFNLIPTDHGRPLTDIKSHLDYQDLRADVEEVLKTLQPLERRVKRDDNSAHYMMRILPYRNPDSSVGGTLVTFVDITNIVQAESAMRAADERKDAFLATLSHELRNPLAPIRTAAGILASDRISDKELKRVQGIISRQATHMMSLLDDLLDISRVTRGVLILKKSYVDLNALMAEVVEVMVPAAIAKSQRLSFTPAPHSLVVEVDPVRITQALTNLLSNAIKYSAQGGEVSVSCEVGGQGVSICVTDNGIGLNPESITGIFEMFNQIDPRFGTADGLGIGLALVKGLAEMHGGSIQASSPGPGQGSKFTILLPTSVIARSIPAQQQSALPNKSVGVPRRVLVADDNQDGAGALEIFLRLHGHEVEVAHSGQEALAKIESFRPDVAVLDIGMPMLNGYEVAEHIRREAWGNGITLIALTGWGQADDKRRALAAGFDKHVTKPVDPAELVRLIE